MGHRRQVESTPSGGLLQVVLFLGSIFVAAYAYRPYGHYRPTIHCRGELHNATADVYFTNGLSEGSVARFQCPRGEYPWPQSSRTCQSNGEWSDIQSSDGKMTFISCRKYLCPDPVKFENGRFHPRGPFFVDSNITFTCNDGYIPRGSMVRTCMENGTWSGETAVCDDGVGHCPDPGIPVGATKRGVRYDVNDIVLYKCIPGLTLFGSSKRTCLQSRRWSGTEVTCHFPNRLQFLEKIDGPYVEILNAHSISAVDGLPFESHQFVDIFTKRKAESNPVLHPYDFGVSVLPHQKSSDKTLQITKDGIINIYILIDDSDGVSRGAFQTMKRNVKILVNKLGVYDTKVQFGVISLKEPEIIVNILDDEDAELVVKIIETALNYTDHESGRDIYGALEEVLWMMSVQEETYKNLGVWESVHHIIMLLTDESLKFELKGRPEEMLKNIRKYLKITGARENDPDVYLMYMKEEPEEPEWSERDLHLSRILNFLNIKIEFMDKFLDEVIRISKYGEMCGLNDGKSFNAILLNPWLVDIILEDESMNFGTLISGRWVLTTAHCFPNISRISEYLFRIDGDNYKAEEIFIHDCYNPSRKLDRGIPHDYDYDVALVKLSSTVTFSRGARPICLPCTEPANRAMKKKKTASCDEHRAFLLGRSDLPAEFVYRSDYMYKPMGWKGVRIKSDNLTEACVSAIQDSDEYKNISVHDLVSPRHLCVQGQMSCERESGGSLLVNIRDRGRFFQVGVLGFGTFNPCDVSYNTEAYPSHARDFSINVMEVLPWLHKHLQGELEFQPDVNNYKEVACPT